MILILFVPLYCRRFSSPFHLIQHGAATHTRTLPDLVTEVTIIDANGNLNTFSEIKNPEEFAAATVNLGLLGIIYTYTLRVEPMFRLRMVKRTKRVDNPS